MKQEEFQALEQDKKLDEIFKSAEKMRKYFKWTLIISVAVIIFPLIGLLFVIPQFLSMYNFSAMGL